MTRIRVFLFLITIIFVSLTGFFVIQYARGYRFDFANLTFIPTGLLVATSTPDGAQIFINGDLRSATNTTISLPPGTLDIEIRKEGFLPWRKRLTIVQEIVTKTDAVLFPAVPSLSPLTFTGAASPVVSPESTKIAYAAAGDKTGLWVIDLADLPLGFSREPRQVTDGDMRNASWTWSPDSRQILLTTPRGTFLVESGTFTPQANLVNIAGTRLTELKKQWTEITKRRFDGQIAKLPGELADIITRRTTNIQFSPDETKVLYTATAEARIPDNLIPPVPGASTQRQERAIKTGQTYVYDIKEDRNFAVGEEGAEIRWFPTSRHLILAKAGIVVVLDYDGTNRQQVWSGPYTAPYAYAFVNATKLVILTNLGASNGNLSNLYALSLR